MEDPILQAIKRELDTVHVDTLSPIEALIKLKQLKDLLA
jgi:hypothetical protein